MLKSEMEMFLSWLLGKSPRRQQGGQLMEALDGSRPKTRAPRGKKRAKSAAVDAFEIASRNRIRSIPEILDFYMYVKRHCLREDAYRELVLNALEDTEVRRIRKLLATSIVATA